MKLSAKLIVGLLVIGAVYYYQRANTKTSVAPQGNESVENYTPSTPRQLPLGQYPLINGDTTLMEMPRLSGASSSYYITHYADGLPNFSLEYDTERRHPRWVCFSYTPKTAQKARTGRTEAWQWDPAIPEKYSTETWFKGSGYSRGHMVASGDRQFSTEANAQTFYYSNMSPQLSGHNAGIWAKLEKKVQKWAQKSSMYHVLYIAKGGTIADGQIEERRIKGKMVIPKYYWMALLLERGGQYHSLAFWTEHKRYDPKTNIQDLAISVNDLERVTGLDLFYHLPDNIEETVESESPNSRVARQLWWSN